MAANPERTAATPSTSRVRLLLIGNPESIHVRRWARAFDARGYEVHVAGFWTPRATDREFSGEVHRLGRPFTAAIALRLLARRIKPDVVHAHYLTHYGWITWASGLRPYAVTLWGSDVLLDPATSLPRRLWARATLRGAAYVTGDSAEVLSRAVELGARPERIREVQFGVDTARFRPGAKPKALAQRLGISGKRVIFAPRALTELYRAHVIVAALERLDRDTVVVATLAGADPGYVRRLERQVRELGLENRVRMLPPIPHAEIDEVYRLADVVVSIPASDGTPVSVLEAMATGRPVVASNLPSVQSWLGEIRRDLLVPVDDPAATSEALARALSLAPDELASIAAAERSRVLARADERGEMDRIEAQYRTMTARARHPAR